MILLLGWGVAGGVTFVAMISSLIRLSPDATRGRIMGLRALAIYGLPIGLVFSGWLAESFGVKQMIIIPSIMGIFGTLLSIIVWPSVFKITFEKLPNKN
jgi:MFS family permease